MKGGKYLKKNIVVKQVDLKDCGACSLLSVIKYYNGYVPLETILIDTHTTRLGTTAFHIIQTAIKYGFDAVGMKVDIDYLEKINLPAIAHTQVDNQYNHFVVIYKYDKAKKQITLMDPAKGIVNVDIDEFLESWTNVIIELYPNSKLPLLKKPNNIISVLLKLIPNEKFIFSKLLLSSIVLSLISIATSFYFKVALNEINNNNLKAFKLIACLFLFLTIIKVIVNYLRDYYETYLNKNIDLKVMMPFLEHLFSLPLNAISNRTTGEIVSRIREINDIKDLFTKVLVTIFLDLLLSISCAIILYNLSAKLFLLLLIIIVLYIIIGLIYSPIIYKKIASNIECETEFNDEVIEQTDGFLTLKNIHRIEMFKKRLEYKYVNFLKDTFDFNHLIINNNFVKNLVNDLGLCLITSFGCYYILKSNLTLINLITFNSLLIYMIDPLKNIIDLLPKINYLKASFNKISEFINLEEEKIHNYHEKFLNGDIKFNNLSYTYNDYNYVLKNLNLNIKKGSKVMFKGNSGCGKSTLCKLLYRLYDLKEGGIKIGKANILDYHLNTIRKNITYLAQKENLFNDTIYNNIVLDRNISTKRFLEVASICRLEDIVEKRPLRYETKINNNLPNLSGGERQRIILARALLKKSYILILDEALSEVETDLERNIIKDIFTFFNEKTIIYVTHSNNEDLFEQVIDFEELTSG